MISLTTGDCAGDAERLKAKGVVFAKEPGRVAYGGMDAVFDDTCSILINLHQDRPRPSRSSPWNCKPPAGR